MKGFKTVSRIQVRFRDTDAMGHVNNAVYLTFLEFARMEYVQQVFGISSFTDASFDGVSFILGRVEIDYKSPAFAGETLRVGVRVSEFGGASFKMAYRIEEEKSTRLVAEAVTVQIGFDYKAGKVRKIDGDFKKLVKEHDNVTA